MLDLNTKLIPVPLTPLERPADNHQGELCTVFAVLDQGSGGVAGGQALVGIDLEVVEDHLGCSGEGVIHCCW